LVSASEKKMIKPDEELVEMNQVIAVQELMQLQLVLWRNVKKGKNY
jgi:hypothetical protein